jgi:hypothetical protein
MAGLVKRGGKNRQSAGGDGALKRLNSAVPRSPLMGGLRGPFAPMGGAYMDPPPRYGIDPAARPSAAGEDQRMHRPILDDGQLDLAVERRGRYFLLHKQASAAAADPSLMQIMR